MLSSYQSSLLLPHSIGTFSENSHIKNVSLLLIKKSLKLLDAEPLQIVISRLAWYVRCISLNYVCSVSTDQILKLHRIEDLMKCEFCILLNQKQSDTYIINY